MQNKKGYSLADIQPLIILLVSVGAIFVMGIYVMTEFRDEVAGRTSETVLNETLASVDETGVAADNESERDCTASTIAIFIANDTPLASTDYSVAGCTWSFNSDTGNTAFNASDWNITATTTYTPETEASAAVYNASTAAGDFASWMPIIIVIVAAAIIIGIVMRRFGQVVS